MKYEVRKYRIAILYLLVTISCNLHAGNWDNCSGKWDNRTGELNGKRILVFTKNGEGFVHDNIESNVEMFFTLAKQEDFHVDTTSNSAIFATSELLLYDAIVFANTNNRVFESQEERDGLVRFTRLGKGFLGIHSAGGTEREWDWFKKMIGGTFDFHPPLQKFTVSVIDSLHPSTLGIPEAWDVNDELYLMKEFNPSVRVLMVSDFSSPAFKSSKPMPTTFGSIYPCVWCNDFEGGRQWFTALGHNRSDYSDPLFMRHILGGLKWVVADKSF